MEEIRIDAQIQMLIEQRNSAQNAVAALAGETAVLKSKIGELELKVAMLEREKQESEGAENG